MEKSHTISEQAVKNATGKSWAEWFEVLAKCKADQMPHKEIARKLQDVHGVDGWWAQSITVQYEKAIGRRVDGQVAKGNFQTSSSKTLDGDIDTVLDLWQKVVGKATEFNGVALSGKSKVSKSDNWRYWKVDLQDGTKISVVIGSKADNKSTLAVNHEKIPNSESAEKWKTFWKEYLKQLQK